MYKVPGIAAVFLLFYVPVYICYFFFKTSSRPSMCFFFQNTFVWISRNVYFVRLSNTKPYKLIPNNSYSLYTRLKT